MNKKLLLISLITLFISVTFVLINQKDSFEEEKESFADFIENHPYANRKPISKVDLKKIAKKDRPDLAFEQDFLRTLDPKTKRLHQDRLVNAINQAATLNLKNKNRKTASFTWESRGPKTVSGRVRAIMFDPNDTENKRVFAGGVSGGIWRNDDVTDENSSWSLVYPDMTNFAVSAIDYDPVNTQTFYAGTGEGWGNVNAVNGAGIWKSTDGGATWSNLASTTNFEFVYDIVVRDEGGSIGVIYAAMNDEDGVDSSATDLFKSDDGGATWSVVSTESIRDLELAADNKIWASTSNGIIMSSSDGTTWNTNYTSAVSSARRVELAIAPSNANVVYALVESGGTLGEVVKTVDAGVTWTQVSEPSDTGDSTIPNDDFTRGQAWYDLIIAVNPTNEDELFAGGVNMFKSVTGGTSWTKASTWESTLDGSVSYAHADIHNILYRPGVNNQIIASTDGGVFYAPDVTKLSFVDGFEPRNLNFNITQFYSAAIDPLATDRFLGGAQDNGTIEFSETGIGNTTELLGGDGGMAYIDQTATDASGGVYYIGSTQNNVVILYDYSQTPAKWVYLINESDKGSFINASDYDDENNVLYSYSETNTITRATLKPDFEDQGSGSNFNGVNDEISIPFLFSAEVSHVRVSPYNKDDRKVFFGTISNRIIKFNAIDDTSTALIAPRTIGAISSIEIGASDDEILVTYSNYGVKSVWYTTNGGLIWTDVEGNLPDMPVRSALFNPLDRKEVILATEAGIWKTSDITAASVNWEPASTGMGSVRVDMLQYRESDNLILAASHGRGMFTSKFNSGVASVSDVLLDNKEFTVYPTISNGNFTVYGKTALGKSNVAIFDITGKQVYKSLVDFSQNEKQAISVNLKPGVYILNINNKKANKIIIE